VEPNAGENIAHILVVIFLIPYRSVNFSAVSIKLFTYVVASQEFIHGSGYGIFYGKGIIGGTEEAPKWDGFG
jgi:hypothetical protein